jgi:hypothetical protein
MDFVNNSENYGPFKQYSRNGSTSSHLYDNIIKIHTTTFSTLFAYYNNRTDYFNYHSTTPPTYSTYSTMCARTKKPSHRSHHIWYTNNTDTITITTLISTSLDRSLSIFNTFSNTLLDHINLIITNITTLT